MTVRTRGARRGAAVAALALLAAGAASGCSAQSGAAAVVHGEPVPVGEVQAAADELGPYLDGATPASVLLVLVAEPTVRDVAAEQGVTVSDQQARRLLTDLASEQDPDAQFSEASVAVARFSLLQRELAEVPDAEAVQSDLLSRLEELDVEVNPRYGELDFAQGGIVPVEHPWLVPDATS